MDKTGKPAIIFTKGKKMKKLISIILCMAMLAGVLAFAGCKNNKDNQDTTAASTGIDAVDAADTTEPSADSTAAESSTAKETKPSGRPTQTVPAAATTEAQVVTLPTNSTEKPDNGSSTGWNGAGNYKCGSGSGKLAPGEYYIVKTSSNYSALLWDGKKKDNKGQPLAYDITIDGTHTLVTLESGYELYISGCKFINTASEHPKAVNGKYAPGTYKIGRDIQKGEYIIKKASGAYGGLSFKKSVDPYVQNVASDFKMVDVSVYYTLSKDGYVHITGCELYDAASHDMASIGCDGTTPAMYKVGKDIKAGTYTITPDGSGKSYYAVYKNSTDATDSARIAETRITKATNVAVSDGEYIWFYKASMKYCQNPNSGLDFDATAASE
ncbi:MAG TPA: hypothetical protein DHV92_06140 [Ruminococcaceae bacterium]|nr:hypothetical protein [Oscillospiraceae bacterium]